MMNLDAKIAELILRAQNSSDGGKRFFRYNNKSKRSFRDNDVGYSRKDLFIETAVNLIASNKTNFKFSVQRDRERTADYLIYFETIINDTKYQVSFHSFDHSLKKYISKKSFRMKWNGRYDSGWQALSIYNYYVPYGTYVE